MQVSLTTLRATIAYGDTDLMLVLVVGLLSQIGTGQFQSSWQGESCTTDQFHVDELGASGCARLKPGNPRRANCEMSDDLHSYRMAWAIDEPTRRQMTPQPFLGPNPTAVSESRVNMEGSGLCENTHKVSDLHIHAGIS